MARRTGPSAKEQDREFFLTLLGAALQGAGTLAQWRQGKTANENDAARTEIDRDRLAMDQEQSSYMQDQFLPPQTHLSGQGWGGIPMIPEQKPNAALGGYAEALNLPESVLDHLNNQQALALFPTLQRTGQMGIADVNADADRAQQGAQFDENLNFDSSRFARQLALDQLTGDRQFELGGRTLDLTEGRDAVSAELGRGSLGLDWANHGLARDQFGFDQEMGRGDLDLRGELGRGSLGLQQMGLNLEQQRDEYGRGPLIDPNALPGVAEAMNIGPGVLAGLDRLSGPDIMRLLQSSGQFDAGMNFEQQKYDEAPSRLRDQLGAETGAYDTRSVIDTREMNTRGDNDEDRLLNRMSFESLMNMGDYRERSAVDTGAHFDRGGFDQSNMLERYDYQFGLGEEGANSQLGRDLVMQSNASKARSDLLSQEMAGNAELQSQADVKSSSIETNKARFFEDFSKVAKGLDASFMDMQSTNGVAPIEFYNQAIQIPALLAQYDPANMTDSTRSALDNQVATWMVKPSSGLGREVYAQLPPEDREMYQLLLASVVEQASRYGLEYTMKTADALATKVYEGEAQPQGGYTPEGTRVGGPFEPTMGDQISGFFSGLNPKNSTKLMGGGDVGGTKFAALTLMALLNQFSKDKPPEEVPQGQVGPWLTNPNATR